MSNFGATWRHGVSPSLLEALNAMLVVTQTAAASALPVLCLPLSPMADNPCRLRQKLSFSFMLPHLVLALHFRHFSGRSLGD